MLDYFWTHDITITPHTGAGSLGDTYGEPATVRGFITGGERMYRDSDGRERAATATVYLPATTSPRPVLQSKITCDSPALAGTVVQLTEWDAGHLVLPECFEVVLA